jgi:hypothetical protein
MIRIVDKNKKIKLSELKKIAEEISDYLVKGVVDVEREIMAIGGELHSDEESFLIEMGSKYENLWGINLYPEREEFIEFDSILNIKPSCGNRSRNVENPVIREKIKKIVKEIVENDL